MKFNYFILLDGKYPRLNLSAAGSTRHFAKGSDCLFDSCADPVSLAPGQKIVFRADLTIGQLCGFFSLSCPTESTQQLGSLIEAAKEGYPDRLGPFLVTAGDDPGLVTLTFPRGTLPGNELQPGYFGKAFG